MYETQQAEEEAELAAHIEALKAADEAHSQKVDELQKAQKQVRSATGAGVRSLVFGFVWGVCVGESWRMRLVPSNVQVSSLKRAPERAD